MTTCIECRHVIAGEKYLRCARSTAPRQDDASLCGEMRLGDCADGRLFEPKESGDGQA